jgi:hypothetical protein
MEHVHHEQRSGRVREKWPGTASVYLTRVCTPVIRRVVGTDSKCHDRDASSRELCNQ